MDALSTQLAFLNNIKTSLPATISLVDELAELLNTSNDSAYRRLRGDIILSVDELIKICNHFKISFEITPQTSAGNIATFSYNKLKDEENGFKNWFLNLSNNISHIASSKNSHIMYAAVDVPIWHHFNSDELIAFKLFYWQKSILNSPDFATKNYDAKFIDSELIDTAKNILNTYNQTTSVEIWTEDTLNSTLKQIEYFWESGFFENKEIAFQLCYEVELSIQLLKQKAEQECKNINTPNGAKDFTLYESEVMLGNNCILVNANNNKSVFVSNNTFNVMSTANEAFVAENEMWLNNITKKSILISGVNEKQRNKFFRQLQTKIDDLKSKIN